MLSSQGECYDLIRCQSLLKTTRRHGHPFIVCERRRFLETLYDNLPNNKAKVRYGQGVVSIDQYDTGVQVTLEDGSIETGDIVVGADGIQSIVRSIMWDHANEKSPETISDSEKKCMYLKNQKFNFRMICTNYSSYSSYDPFQVHIRILKSSSWAYAWQYDHHPR